MNTNVLFGWHATYFVFVMKVNRVFTKEGCLGRPIPMSMLTLMMGC